MVEKTQPGLSQIKEIWEKQKQDMKAKSAEAAKATKASVPCKHGNLFSCNEHECRDERKKMLESMCTDGTAPKEDDALMEATDKGLDKALEQSGKRKF